MKYKCPECGSSEHLSVEVLVDPNHPFPAGLTPGETYAFECGACGVEYSDVGVAE